MDYSHIIELFISRIPFYALLLIHIPSLLKPPVYTPLFDVLSRFSKILEVIQEMNLIDIFGFIIQEMGFD